MFYFGCLNISIVLFFAMFIITYNWSFLSQQLHKNQFIEFELLICTIAAVVAIGSVATIVAVGGSSISISTSISSACRSAVTQRSKAVITTGIAGIVVVTAIVTGFGIGMADSEQSGEESNESKLQ